MVATLEGHLELLTTLKQQKLVRLMGVTQNDTQRPSFSSGHFGISVDSRIGLQKNVKEWTGHSIQDQTNTGLNPISEHHLIAI